MRHFMETPKVDRWEWRLDQIVKKQGFPRVTNLDVIGTTFDPHRTTHVRGFRDGMNNFVLQEPALYVLRPYCRKSAQLDAMLLGREVSSSRESFFRNRDCLGSSQL